MSVETSGLAAPPVAQDPPQPEQLRFLLVEDNVVDVELVERGLRRAGFDFTSAVVQTPEDFTRELRANRPHVVLADYNLPHWRGMEALEILAREGLDVPLILVTGALGDMTAVDCIKEGATDYVLKGALTRLPIAIRRALLEKGLREQRQLAEKKLAEKVEELARSNRDLEQFAYVASHDLQEPLRMVAAYTQLLAERYRGKLDENADKYIGYAVEGALRMQTLILDLLAFSRVGRAETDRKNGECNAALNNALENLRSAIEESGAVVTHDHLPAVAVDPTQLVQLFQNLIGNAIKFRGKEVPTIRVSAEKQDATWLFAVADNGIGVSSQYKDKIFVIFQRLHTREEYSGNGVGLAICKKIVEHHGGRIWVESEIGCGATFHFTLPDSPADQEDHNRRQA
jgi:signal transduction histidine kinase